MCKVTVMPKGADAEIPTGTQLTELEDENSDCVPFDRKAGACSSCITEVLNDLANISARETDETSLLGIAAKLQQPI